MANQTTAIWKVSHGFAQISEEQSKWLDDNHLLSVHSETGKGQGDKFQTKIKIGDIVSLSRSGYLKALVEVTSDVITKEDSPLDREWLLREYKVLKWLPDLQKYHGKTKGWSPNYNSTVGIVLRRDFELFETEILQPFFQMNLSHLFGSEVTEELKKNYARKASNEILYGPPGTGKTYHLLSRFAEYTTKAQAQSRPVWLSEKLAPLNWMQILVLCLLDIGQQAKVAEIIKHEYYLTKAGLNGRLSNLAQTAWSYLQTYTIPDSETVKFSSRREPAIFNKTPESYWYLVQENFDRIDDLVELHKELMAGPQSEQTIKRYSCVTFHQSYGYEEFIEGLKAKTTDEDAITYVVESGEFVKLCRRAEQDPENRYAIFIDEINRGNVSKIFGELITLIEPDKRAGEPNQVEIQLAYSGTAFSVPKNVDIIGTMNTADRSLTMLDTALRRRFDFVEMMPDPDVLGDISVKGIHLANLLRTLNERIDVLYDREHTLGHAFLIPVKVIAENESEDAAFDTLVSVFQNKIIPLLQEYFFEDWQKIRLVLGDNQKPAELQFVTEEKLTNQSLDALFGTGHGLNQYGDEQRRYTLQLFSESVWQDPQAYSGIYSKVASQKSESEMNQMPEGADAA